MSPHRPTIDWTANSGRTPIQNVRVSHGRYYILVCQDFLIGTDFVSSFNAMCCERVTKGVTTASIADRRSIHCILHCTLNERWVHIVPSVLSGLAIPSVVFPRRCPRSPLRLRIVRIPPPVRCRTKRRDRRGVIWRLNRNSAVSISRIRILHYCMRIIPFRYFRNKHRLPALGELTRTAINPAHPTLPSKSNSCHTTGQRRDRTFIHERYCTPRNGRSYRSPTPISQASSGPSPNS